MCFEEIRPFLENEFENAHFDPASGLSPEELLRRVREIVDVPDEAYVLARAKAYRFILENAQIEMNPRTPFGCKLNIGVDYSYFATPDFLQAKICEPRRNAVNREKLTPEEFTHLENTWKCGVGSVFTDFWHTVPDWNEVLRLGFVGLLDRARQAKAARLAQGETDRARLDFLESVILCYEGMFIMLRRFLEASRKQEMPEFTAALEALLVRAPETFYEALLTQVLFVYFEEIGWERARSLGPVDLLWAPYWERDLARGVPEETLEELVRFFFIHFTATKRYAQQPLTLGGRNADGTTRVNFLTERLLEIYDGMNIYDPKIHFRYHAGIDRALLRKIADMIRRGNSSVCLVNDETVYAAYARQGVPPEDAEKYVLLGCYEPILMGLEEAEIGPGWMNIVKPVELALFGGVDPLTGTRLGPETPDSFASFDDFLQAVFVQLDSMMDFALFVLQKQGTYSTLVNPSPIYSSTFAACMDAAKDVHEWPLKYNNVSLKLCGHATAVDSLAAIRKFVFERKELTLDELRGVLRKNFSGFEELRLRIRKDPEKYGNGLDGPDGIFRALLDHLRERWARRPLDRGGVLRLGLDSITNCIILGEQTGATPDGRLSGTPLSRNLTSTVGMDRAGPLGLMQTVLKVPAEDFLDAVIWDFFLHPTQVKGEKGLESFVRILEYYFSRGGFAAMGNVADTETLRDAQAHPENYRTLQIRLCGWNEYFVNMSRAQQDLFIAQAEA